MESFGGLHEMKKVALQTKDHPPPEESNYGVLWSLGGFIHEGGPEPPRAVEILEQNVRDETQDSMSSKGDIKECIGYPQVILKDDKDNIKNEPLEIDNQASRDSNQSDMSEAEEKPQTSSVTYKENNISKPNFETISIKGYISKVIKEEPFEDVGLIYTKSALDYEKKKFHQDIFCRIVKNTNSIKKVVDLEAQYISQLRKVANVEVFTCSTCCYETIHKTNMNLHLWLIHKMQADDLKMFKCTSCDYTAKSVKYMQKHASTHKCHSNDKTCDDNISENSFENDKDFCSSDWSSEDDVPLSKRKSTENQKNTIKKILKKTRRARTTRNRIRIIHKCPHCDFESKTKTKLKQHLLSHNEITIKKCDLCPFEADKYDALKSHKTTHKCQETNRYLCYKCEYATLDKGLLKKHLLKEHKIITEGLERIIVYKCDSCPYETDLKRSLEIHSMSHKNEEEIEWFICEICNFKTKHKKSLKEHSFTHKKPEEIEKKFMCEVCSVKFRTKAALKRHLVVHQTIENAEEIFKCPHCPHKAKRKSYLIAHLLKHKDPSELSMFVCEICGFQTKRKWNIEMHKITHKKPEEVETYSCGVCAYQTRFKDRLKRHLQKGNHTGMGKETRGFVCSTCNFETKNRKQYCRHVMSHKGQPVPTELKGNFICDICGFRTLYKSSLQNHSRTHMNMDEIRTFQCPECEYKTKFKGNLKHHIKIHKDPSELTLYKCPTCGLAAKNKWNYKMHLLTHKSSDQVEIIKCKLCSYQTKFKGYMQVHLKKAHKVVTRRNEYSDYIIIVNPQQQQTMPPALHEPHQVIQPTPQFDFKMNL